MSAIAKFNLETHKDTRGYLVVNEHFPFEVKRAFWIYHSIGQMRGEHANRESDMILCCQMGEIKLWLEYAGKREEYHLRSNESRAIFIPKMTWVRFKALTRGALTLVFCSKEYDEADYIREKKEYEDEIQQSG